MRILIQLNRSLYYVSPCQPSLHNTISSLRLTPTAIENCLSRSSNLFALSQWSHSTWIQRNSPLLFLLSFLKCFATRQEPAASSHRSASKVDINDCRRDLQRTRGNWRQMHSSTKQENHFCRFFFFQFSKSTAPIQIGAFEIFFTQSKEWKIGWSRNDI